MKALSQSFKSKQLSFDASDEIKISMYVPCDSNPRATKDALILVAERLMKTEIDSTQREELLAPLRALEPQDPFKGTIAIFRSSKDFRVVRLAHVLPPKIVVANSYHLKPLLWCKQRNRIAKVFILNSASLSAYEVSSEGAFGPIVYPLPKQDDPRSLEEFQQILGLEDDRIITRVFAGESFQLGGFVSSLPTSFPWSAFAKQIRSAQDLELLFVEARRLVSTELLRQQRAEIKAAIALPQAILELRPRRIVDAIKKKTVRKVFVSLEDSLWGELDFESGMIKYNPRQMNIRDDDILDDIVELSEQNQIEYQVVSRRLMPLGVCAIAC